MEEASCESSRSQPINSFLFSLRMRKEMKLMELLLCCPRERFNKEWMEWMICWCVSRGGAKGAHQTSWKNWSEVWWSGRARLVCFPLSRCRRRLWALSAMGSAKERERKETNQPNNLRMEWIYLIEGKNGMESTCLMEWNSSAAINQINEWNGAPSGSAVSSSTTHNFCWPALRHQKVVCCWRRDCCSLWIVE